MDIPKELPRLTFYRGRVAMYHILKALGVGPGDAVATQAFTCVAVPEGILATGAKPVFVDTEEGGVNMCPTDLERKLDGRVKAVIVQHTFGIPAQMAELRSILGRHGLPIVEDCCHTYASTYVNQVVGTFGAGAFYSFEWGKPLIAGIGGSAILNDNSLFKSVEAGWESCHEPSFVRVLKIQLQYAAFMALYKPSKYWQVRSMFQRLSRSGAAEGNYNPTEGVAEDFSMKMAAPLRKRLRSLVPKADQIRQNAQEIVAKYEGGLRSRRIRKPLVPNGGVPVYARYPLLSPEKARMIARAEEANVEVAEWYKTPIHPLDRDDWAQVHYEPGSCPRAEMLSDEIVSLPVNQKVTDRDIERTLRLLEEF